MRNAAEEAILHFAVFVVVAQFPVFFAAPACHSSAVVCLEADAAAVALVGVEVSEHRSAAAENEGRRSAHRVRSVAAQFEVPKFPIFYNVTLLRHEAALFEWIVAEHRGCVQE